MSKRFASLFLSICMLLSFAGLSANAQSTGLENFQQLQTYTDGQYRDVLSDNIFADNIKTAFEFGIMQGYGETFGVKDNITRLASLIIACRLHCIYYNGTNDVEALYQNRGYTIPTSLMYMLYADEHGIYAPDGSIRENATRAEFAAILSSALPDEALPKINYVLWNAIPDVLINMNHGKEIYRLYDAGVITGSDSSGTFHPTAYITRGAACAIATRMISPELRQSITLDTRAPSAERGKMAVESSNINLQKSAEFVVSLMYKENNDYSEGDLTLLADFDSNVIDVQFRSWNVWGDTDGIDLLAVFNLTPISNGTTTIRFYVKEKPSVYQDVTVTITNQ